MVAESIVQESPPSLHALPAAHPYLVTRAHAEAASPPYPVTVAPAPLAPESLFTIEELVALRFGAASPATVGQWYHAVKRTLDIGVAVVGLGLCLPLFLVIALLIRLDSPGPVFFLQPRAGYRGRLFLMVKFRTMTGGGAVRLNGGVHKMRDDLRVTRVGRFLRALSLDELPQLLNVLRGDMSLVGPRPELPEIVQAEYAPWQYERFLVPQGMTGWWQVTGRGNKLCHRHTADDLHYIAHASLWFDLKILVMTVRAVMQRDGAF